MIAVQTLLYFILSQIGSQRSCCMRGVSFDGVELASVELQSSECP